MKTETCRRCGLPRHKQSKSGLCKACYTEEKEERRNEIDDKNTEQIQEYLLEIDEELNRTSIVNYLLRQKNRVRNMIEELEFPVFLEEEKKNLSRDKG